jgi:hypothetical protein
VKSRDEILESYKSHLARYLSGGEYSFPFDSLNIRRGAVDPNFDILPIIYIWEDKEAVTIRNQNKTRVLPIVVEGYFNPKAYSYENDSTCMNAFLKELLEITARYNETNPKNPFTELENDVFYIIGEVTMMAIQIRLAVNYVTTY